MLGGRPLTKILDVAAMAAQGKVLVGECAACSQRGFQGDGERRNFSIVVKLAKRSYFLGSEYLGAEGLPYMHHTPQLEFRNSRFLQFLYFFSEVYSHVIDISLGSLAFATSQLGLLRRLNRRKSNAVAALTEPMPCEAHAPGDVFQPTCKCKIHTCKKKQVVPLPCSTTIVREERRMKSAVSDGSPKRIPRPRNDETGTRTQEDCSTRKIDVKDDLNLAP